jgi:hypothetical protein
MRKLAIERCIRLLNPSLDLPAESLCECDRFGLNGELDLKQQTARRELVAERRRLESLVIEPFTHRAHPPRQRVCLWNRDFDSECAYHVV